jgi:excisionase family DNA binding protein
VSTGADNKISRLLTTAELADRLGLPLWRVHEMCLAGTGPRFIRIGRTRRFPEHLVAEWVEENARPDA